MKKNNLLKIVSFTLLVIITSSCSANNKALEDRDIILPDKFNTNSESGFMDTYSGHEFQMGIDDNERKMLRIDDFKNPGLRFDDDMGIEIVSLAYEGLKNTDNKNIAKGEILDETAKGRVQLVYIMKTEYHRAVFLVSYDNNGDYIDSHLLASTESLHSITTAQYNLITLHFSDGGEGWGDYIQLNKDMKFVKPNWDTIDRMKINH